MGWGDPQLWGNKFRGLDEEELWEWVDIELELALKLKLNWNLIELFLNWVEINLEIGFNLNYLAATSQKLDLICNI